jgi:drug/metabolite transporter (DMT)-like permease
MKRPILAWYILFSLSLIWGSSFILIKKGLIVLDPGEVAALRIVAASIALFPFAIGRIKQIDSKNIWFLISVGLTGSLLPSLLFAIAQTQISSSITGVINALTPFFTILTGIIFYNTKSNQRVFFGMLVGLIGTTILILSGSKGTLSVNYYAFYVVLATVCYGVNLNLIKQHLQGLKSLTITSLSLAIVLFSTLGHPSLNQTK